METKKTIYVNAVNQADQVSRFYLNLENNNHLPLVLGTGRNAVVFLATTTEHESEATDYRAIKFLRDDIDTQYAQASAVRFFQEADKAKRFDRLQGTFVKYFGWGAIDIPLDIDDDTSTKNFWWSNQLKRHKKDLIENTSNSDELVNIKSHFKLQGPFYVLDLCQGTLYDLLDKNTPWSKLPAYSIANFHDSLLFQTKTIKGYIDEIASKYLSHHPAGRSGYDILNDFKKEDTANMIRNRAVLEVFQKVAYTVSQLHKKREITNPQTGLQRKTDPLAHRDLKPGNIFLQHNANIHGLDNIRIQLSDLGYVTNASQIIRGDVTLRAGRRGLDYQAPGSQYYRAPEQAELPVEVRVDVDPSGPNLVRVRGSKIDRIEVHDWLSLSDIFNSEQQRSDEDASIFRILESNHKEDDSGVFYQIQLEVDQDKSLSTSRTEDLQGQIIRATGFQTDGFSLGAILYDLISGGKDPQLFYTYCIVSLTSQFDKKDYSIDSIVDILAPERLRGMSIGKNEIINFSERRRIMSASLDTEDLDNLIETIMEISLRTSSFQSSKKLKLSDKISIIKTAIIMPDIDDIVATLIKSPLFNNSVENHKFQGLDDVNKQKLTDSLRNYRFRNFHLVSDLLRDRRGVRIPHDILRIIVSCMIRDVEGSYYRRDSKHGFTSEFNYEAATRIYDDVSRLLGEPQYSLPKTGFPRELEEDLLFKLRSLASLKEQVVAQNS
jgi:serine/threonine protein kinase